MYFTYYKNNTYAAPTTYTQVAGNVGGTGEIHTTGTLRIFQGNQIMQTVDGGAVAVFFYLGDDGTTRTAAV